MDTKKCSKCGEIKIFEEFARLKLGSDKRTSHCKQCRKDYHQANKEKLKEWNKNNYYLKMEDPNFRELRKKRNQNYYNSNKDKISTHRSTRSERDKTNKYYMNKRKTDPNYAISCNVSSRIRTALKRNKFTSSEYLTGCSISDLRIYIESLWEEGMSWDNYGNPNGNHTHCWHLDHIIPCNAFDLTKLEQQKICFHYTNMQPLWAIDNLRKGDKIMF